MVRLTESHTPTAPRMEFPGPLSLCDLCVSSDRINIGESKLKRAKSGASRIRTYARQPQQISSLLIRIAGTDFKSVALASQP